MSAYGKIFHYVRIVCFPNNGNHYSYLFNKIIEQNKRKKITAKHAKFPVIFEIT